jgi:hypothetical protein
LVLSPAKDFNLTRVEDEVTMAPVHSALSH